VPHPLNYFALGLGTVEGYAAGDAASSAEVPVAFNDFFFGYAGEDFESVNVLGVISDEESLLIEE